MWEASRATEVDAAEFGYRHHLRHLSAGVGLQDVSNGQVAVVVKLSFATPASTSKEIFQSKAASFAFASCLASALGGTGDGGLLDF